MTPLLLLPFVAAYVAVVLVVGYAAVSAVVGDAGRHWAEVAGLSVAAGTGLTASALFLASVAGVVPGRGVLAGWAMVAAVAAAAVLLRRGRLLTPSVPSPRRRLDPTAVVGLLGMVVVLAAVLNAVAAGTTPGLGDIDEYATWMFKAKVLAVEPLRPVPAAFLDPGLSYSHQDYPLLFPLLVAGVYAAVGRVDESAGKLLLFPMYLAVIGVVYAAVRRDNRRAIAVAVTAVAVAGPTVVQKAGLAVAELPLTMFLAAAVSMLSRWSQRHDRADLLLAGGFAAAAAFSKNEGLALLPVFAAAAAAYAICQPDRRRLLAHVGAATAVAIVLIGPWLVYRLGLPKTHEDYGGRFASLDAVRQGVARLPHVLVGVAGWMLDVGSAGGVWVVLACSAVVGHRAWGRGPTRLLWGVLVAQLGLYVAAFLVTPWDVGVLLPMVTSKLLCQAAPTAGILIGLHLAVAGSARDGSTSPETARAGRPA